MVHEIGLTRFLVRPSSSPTSDLIEIQLRIFDVSLSRLNVFDRPNIIIKSAAFIIKWEYIVRGQNVTKLGLESSCLKCPNGGRV